MKGRGFGMECITLQERWLQSLEGMPEDIQEFVPKT
jgi:hypothetical protein